MQLVSFWLLELVSDIYFHEVLLESGDIEDRCEGWVMVPLMVPLEVHYAVFIKE